MFTTFKEKLQSVHNNLTTSFRGLAVADPVLPNLPRKHPVDFNAGADLLHKYQTQWQDMHQLAEENASAAQKVDVRITKLHSEVTKQQQALTHLDSELTKLPKLCEKTDEIISQIESLGGLVEVVEGTLLELADTVERKELQELELESRFQLAIHSEKRLAQLEALREKLSEEHRLKIMQYEKEFGRRQKERQETFGKAFEDDLETYKQTGSVPTIRPPMTSGPSLEEVELDIDTKALDQMLEE